MQNHSAFWISTVNWNWNYSSIATFGGIFGLCLGGSVISLVEIVYFYTLRLYHVIINQSSASNSKPESKRVSISNNVKTIEINPKSFMQNFKAYQQFDRQPKSNRRNTSIFGSNANMPKGNMLLGKTALHEFNKPGVQEFLK